MSRLPLALAGFMLAAAPAAADVTPREVWDGWLASLEESDAEVSTGSVEESGDGLKVTDLSITATSSDDDTYAIELEELVLTPNSDGTVNVATSPEYALVLTGEDEDGIDREIHLLVQHPELNMTVAEQAGVRQHVFAAPQVSVVFDEILKDGEPVDASGRLVFEDTRGRYDVGEDEGPSAFSAARVKFETNGADRDTGDRFAARIEAADFESVNLLQIVGTNTAALARDLAPGESLSASFRIGAATFEASNESENDSSSFSGTTGPGDTSISLTAEGLDYASETQDLVLAFYGSALPLPEVTLDVGDATLALKTPLLADGEPQPYALGISLLDVALDEGLWNMVDPAGILPRSRGEITLDVSGATLVERDVDARDMADDDTGAQLRTVSINTARIVLADAEVEATGDFSAVESTAGIPMLAGELDVTLTGATQLLDKLVQAGIVPQEQAMGAQMMLGMFARPGATEDELVSTIRMTEDGRVFVNDQQVR